MMARKDIFPDACPTAFTTTYELEGSSSSGRMDTENTASEHSSASRRKWLNLNSAARDCFPVPVQVVPLSKLTPSERKNLVLRLRSELEQIRLLQKKVESQKVNANALSSSSDILSCSNPQKGPPGGSIKRSSGFSYGPGMKASAPGQKGRGWQRGRTGRFESVKKTPVDDANVALLKQCENLLKKLMSHQFGWVFNKPVDVVALKIPDYFSVIKHPMDLGTIKTKLASGQYSSPLEFLADVRLTFSNAMTYNPPGNDVHSMADTVSKFFEARWKAIKKKIPVISSRPDDSELHEEIEIVDPVARTKKRKRSPPQTETVQRKVSPVHHEALPQEAIKQKMTDEEKHDLSRDLEASLGDLPDNIIEFLKEQSSNGREFGEDEIEIDIDDLSDDTLFTLRKLLDEFIQGKRNNNPKAEPCEIELQNESGLSNSSMQLDKGNDHVDEDIDICRHEPPTSGYPPVEIVKDTKNISKKGSNAETYDGNSDSDSSSSSDSESECPKASRATKDDDGSVGDYNGKPIVDDMVDRTQSVSGLDQVEQKPISTESDSCLSGDGATTEGKVSPEKLYRAAILKKRFLDTILKAREKSLGQVEKSDPEKLRREMEELELLKRKEKARLQAEAKAAENARRRAEAEAAAEAKRQREVEREAARQALLKIEKTVEINENSRFLEDLEMLSAVPLEHLPSSVGETSPDLSQDGLGSFKFGSSNPLEQLGLYMKVDDEEEEADPTNAPDVINDVEEGEID